MIPLIEGLAMTADERCYIVGEPRQKADKGIVLDKPTYHPTAAQAASAALRRAMRKGVADGSIATLREFIHEQNRQRGGAGNATGPARGRQAPSKRGGGPRTSRTGQGCPYRQRGRETVIYTKGRWYYRGRTYDTLHAALLAVWPRKEAHS